MDISEKSYINLVIMLHCIHLKVVTGFNFANNYCNFFFGCRICVKANSVDPNKMPHFCVISSGPSLFENNTSQPIFQFEMNSTNL